MGGWGVGGVGAVSFFKALTGTSVRIMNLFLRLLLFALHSRAHPGEGGPCCLGGGGVKVLGAAFKGGVPPPNPPTPPFPRSTRPSRTDALTHVHSSYPPQSSSTFHWANRIAAVQTSHLTARLKNPAE